jgi:acyl-CoA dehydrogenase
VDFAPSAVADDYTKRMRAFLDDRILPAEAAYAEFRAARRGTPSEWELPPVVEELKAEARAQGLWNLFLPSLSGLSNLEYAAVAEVTGWSPDIAPEVINCQAPDTGNMETLHLFGTPEQKEQWLEPLLAGEIRSALGSVFPITIAILQLGCAAPEIHHLRPLIT